MIGIALYTAVLSSGVEGFATRPLLSTRTLKLSETSLNSAVASLEDMAHSANRDVMLELKHIEDLGKMIDNADKDQLCVVTFHTNYCKVCQKVMPKFKRIAQLEGSDGYASYDIQFAAIDCSRLITKNLQKIGVTRFPFMQIWRNGECVVKFSTPASAFSRTFRRQLNACINRSNDEWGSYREEFEADITRSTEALASLRQITP